MRIAQLQIERFRGIESALVDFSDKETMLIGPNGAGKSTILEALALLFGRDRLVRTEPPRIYRRPVSLSYATNAGRSSEA
jgi:predicted ATP-dependent endonuclease of OLD family